MHLAHFVGIIGLMQVAANAHIIRSILEDDF